MQSRRVADTALLLCGVLALATLFASLAETWWAFDLFTHFRVQYAAAGLVLAPALWWLKRRWAALVSLSLAGAQLWFVVPLFLPAAEASTDADTHADAEPLHVVAHNVFGYSRGYARTFAYLNHERPDVLVLLEVTPAWAKALEGFGPEYSYRWVHPGGPRSGIAVLSRHEPVASRELDLGETGDPSLLLTLDSENGPISLLAMHLYWPLGAYSSAVRNRQLRSIAQLARSHPLPLVVAGDLNTTPFSPHFRRLLQDGKLNNCADGDGLHATWPARVPFLFIQLDYCLATPGVHAERFRVGEFVGSDHYPIAFDVGVARPGPRR